MGLATRVLLCAYVFWWLCALPCALLYGIQQLLNSVYPELESRLVLTL
jgi:hypothetical protein